MSIRLIDEIYAELHNGQRPPYTNAREPLGYGLSVLEALLLNHKPLYDFDYDPYDFDYDAKFKVSMDSGLIILPAYYIPPIADSPPSSPSSQPSSESQLPTSDSE